jgi:hypothetical protein
LAEDRPISGRERPSGRESAFCSRVLAAAEEDEEEEESQKPSETGNPGGSISTPEIPIAEK